MGSQTGVLGGSEFGGRKEIGEMISKRVEESSVGFHASGCELHSGLWVFHALGRELFAAFLILRHSCKRTSENTLLRTRPWSRCR